MVHIHAEGPAFFCWIPKLFGKRVISTIHGLDWAREKWRGSVASKFIRGGEKNAVKYADEIIVLSKGVQKYFMDTYGRETHFIPNGVNRPEVREAKLITDNFGLKKDSYILFLGRLVPEKGIRYLVEAFKNVKTDKKLVIAGGSSDTDSFMEELKELAKGDDRILFTGFVQGAMLDELYSNAYIYTLPSDLEGMPLSLLEAMSYGNCCLVSDIPECAEVVEDKDAKVAIKKIALAVLGMIVVVVLVQSIPYLYDMIWLRIENAINTVLGKDSSDTSAMGRDFYKAIAFIMFKQKPWIGYGVDGFVCFLRDHPTIMGVYMKPVYSHCNYSELAADFGIVGLLLWYIPIVRIFYWGWQTKSSGYIEGCIYAIFVSIVISDYGKKYLLW